MIECAARYWIVSHRDLSATSIARGGLFAHQSPIPIQPQMRPVVGGGDVLPPILRQKFAVGHVVPVVPAMPRQRQGPVGL